MNIVGRSEDDSRWLEYADPRNRFALSHPPEWQIVRGVTGLLVSVVAPEIEEGAFRSNLNLVRRIQDTSLDLDGLTRSALRSLLRLLNDAIVIDVDTAVVSGHAARRLLMAYRQGMQTLTSEQWLFLAGDHMWTISAGALTEGWDAVTDTFTLITQSLRLTVQ